MTRRLASAALLGLLATGCVTSPLDTTGVTNRLTPSQVAGADAGFRGERVQWGGHIVSIVNSPRSTRIEVLSYPVGRDGFPNSYRKPTGRFVLEYQGFLEPVDYTPGRILTVVGTVDSLMKTSVGNAEFLVPLVRAEQLELWPSGYGDRGRSGFGLGVGISFGF